MSQEPHLINASFDLVVFASGQGTNLRALHQGFVRSTGTSAVSLFVTDKPQSNSAKWAKETKINTVAVPLNAGNDRSLHESALLEELKKFAYIAKNQVVVILAGYMRILSKNFLAGLKMLWPHCLIVNLHPAYLGDYKGPNAHAFAVRNKYSRWGLTLHKVTEFLDEGEELATTEVFLFPYESVSQMQDRIKTQENQFLVHAIATIISSLTNETFNNLK